MEKARNRKLGGDGDAAGGYDDQDGKMGQTVCDRPARGRRGLAGVPDQEGLRLGPKTLRGLRH